MKPGWPNTAPLLDTPQFPSLDRTWAIRVINLSLTPLLQTENTAYESFQMTQV